MINSSSYRTYHMQIRTSQANTVKINTVTSYRQILLNIANRNWFTYLVHVPIWLLLYFFPQLLYLAVNAKLHLSFFEPGNPVYLLSFNLVIIFSYLNYYWLVPGFFIRKAVFKYFLLTTGFISVITWLQYMAAAGITTDQQALFYSSDQYMIVAGLGYTVILLIISVFSSMIIRLNEELAEGKKEIMKMKISFLNNQINPHFLFNSLNWIYLLAIKKSRETPNAIIQLSGLMRYILKETNAGLIDLTNELDYISNYVSLQKGRLGNTISLNCSIPAYTGTGKIAPLLAMSFIENAFIHGVNPDEDSAIIIDIAITGNRFCLQAINNKVSPAGRILHSGAGIKNARQRLQMLYPSMHQLEILEDDKIYSVKLSINIL